MATRKNFTPAQTGYFRVFLIEGRARPDHVPEYQGFMKGGGISHGVGDVTKIEAPDPSRRNEFIEVGQIQGAEDRPTTSIVGLFPADVKSRMLQLMQRKCPFDVVFTIGLCDNPSIYNSSYTKKIILENARFTNYGTDDLGALNSGERAQVNETGDISTELFYETVPSTFSEKAADIVTNEVVDVVMCDQVSCGDCTDESNGCEKIYAITLSAGGSASTPSDIVYSIDGGVTWYAADIDSLLATEDADEIECLGDNLVVVSQDSVSLHYADKDDFDGVTDPAWTEVTTGFVAAGAPRAIWSSGSRAFIVGAGGYIYYTDDPTAGVTVSDAGVLFPLGTFNAVHGISDEFAVAVGNGSIIAKTENGLNWTSVLTVPTGVGVNYNTVWVKSEKEWWIGSSAGRLYYTLNGGETWTEKSFPGSGAGVVRDIFFASDTVAYLAHDTATPRGRILVSKDGGNSWVVTPEGSGNLPLSDRINALTACSYDVDRVVGVGLADNASDGFIVVGLPKGTSS